uniref:Uncharacterized protein n=1 Tax=Arundo donax TaxID=35708 RepID=A0A0A9DCH2_ARUDO
MGARRAKLGPRTSGRRGSGHRRRDAGGRERWGWPATPWWSSAAPRGWCGEKRKG